MKKLLAGLAALLFCIQCSAFAFTGTGYPVPADGIQPADQIAVNFDSFSALLDLDASQDFSGIADGINQACFFAYNENRDHYLELYLMIPESVCAGDVITQDSAASGSAAATGVYLYEVDSATNTDTVWVATSIQGFCYPDGSAFTVTIQNAETAGNSVHITGTLSATLYALNSDATAGEKLTISDSPFDFTLSTDAQPNASQSPEGSPLPGEDSSPVSTSTPAPGKGVKI